MCTEKHRKPTQRGSEEGGYSKEKTNQMYGEQHDQEIRYPQRNIQVADIFLFPHSSSQHLD